MEGNIATEMESIVDLEKHSITKEDYEFIPSNQLITEISESPPTISSTPEMALTIQSFHQQGFLSKEKWAKNFFFKSKIIDKKGDIIVCDCLMDEEQQFFQTREFPIILFKHLKKIKIGALVYIKTLLRPGASKIEIYDGNGIVDPELFNDEAEWESLRNTEQPKPFGYD